LNVLTSWSATLDNYQTYADDDADTDADFMVMKIQQADDGTSSFVCIKLQEEQHNKKKKQKEKYKPPKQQFELGSGKGLPSKVSTYPNVKRLNMVTFLLLLASIPVTYPFFPLERLRPKSVARAISLTARYWPVRGAPL